MIETHKSATSLAMIFCFVLHFFDFAVDVCHYMAKLLPCLTRHLCWVVRKPRDDQK